MIYALWHGGANYAPGTIDDDLETFEDVDAARDAAWTRARTGNHFQQDFDYVTRDAASVLTPNVGEDSEIVVWLTDPRESDDPYPDRIIRWDISTGYFEVELT